MVSRVARAKPLTQHIAKYQDESWRVPGDQPGTHGVKQDVPPANGTGEKQAMKVQGHEGHEEAETRQAILCGRSPCGEVFTARGKDSQSTRSRVRSRRPMMS